MKVLRGKSTASELTDRTKRSALAAVSETSALLDPCVQKESLEWLKAMRRACIGYSPAKLTASNLHFVSPSTNHRGVN